MIQLSDKIRKQCHDLRSMYLEDCEAERLRLILYGEKGSAKTSIACTARKPIYIDSFDPGGTTVKRIQADIKNGYIIPDVRWEKKSLKDDFTTITNWFEEMKMREREGLFDNIGTYLLDGGTLFSEFLMRSVIQLDKTNTTSSGEAPIAQIQNYYPFQQRIVNIMKGFSKLPCDVIVTFHAAKIKDQTSGALMTAVAMPGEKAPEVVASVFGEMWMTNVKSSAKGMEFKILTQRDGIFKAVTRIGDGVFEKFEEPDICKMLQKCGWNTEPKKFDL